MSTALGRVCRATFIRPHRFPFNTSTCTASYLLARRSQSTKSHHSSDDSTPVITQRPSLLEESKVQAYLDYVASSSHSLTLEDVESHRPKSHSPPESRQYESEYNQVVEDLLRSFSSAQLRDIGDMYGLEPPKRRTKWNLVTSIVERQWGWPSLSAIKEEKRNSTEILSTEFPLTPCQSFLVLGKDGADLLAMSTKYNVHVSLSPQPLCLKVEGLRASTEALAQYVNEAKREIESQTFELPGGGHINNNTLQRISRLSGAFVENVAPGRLRVSFRPSHGANIINAQILAIRSSREHKSGDSSLGIVSPSEATTSEVAAYLSPMFSNHASPWNVSTTGVFRLRRAQDAFSMRDVLRRSLRDLHGWIPNSSENGVNILSHLQKKSSDASTQLVASYGHILHYPSPSQHLTLTPPIAENLNAIQTLQWLNENGYKRFFAPSPMLAPFSASTAHSRRLRRIVYNLLEGQGSPTARGNEVLQIDVGLSVSSDGELDGSWTCWNGVQSRIDLMMPLNDVDMRFTISNGELLADENWPSELVDYRGRCEKSRMVETPPAVISLQGRDYLLHGTFDIQNEDKGEVVPGTSHAGCLTQKKIDLEARQETTSSQVVLHNVTEEASWNDFVRVCDQVQSEGLAATHVQR